MTYPQGVQHMTNLYNALAQNEKNHFTVGSLRIDYPGYKKKGDYRLSRNGVAPTHINIVNGIYNMVTPQNFNELKEALDDLYTYGLTSTNTFFAQTQKELIYWITLQEEINYPQPRYAGRKLPYQRFFEGALAKIGHLTINNVRARTNNHGVGRPVLFNCNSVNIIAPSFYI